MGITYEDSQDNCLFTFTVIFIIFIIITSALGPLGKLVNIQTIKRVIFLFSDPFKMNNLNYVWDHKNEI